MRFAIILSLLCACSKAEAPEAPHDTDAKKEEAAAPAPEAAAPAAAPAAEAAAAAPAAATEAK